MTLCSALYHLLTQAVLTAAALAHAGGTDCHTTRFRGRYRLPAALVMETRSHIHEESFDIPPERMFELLVTPSAIRSWWGASRAIVLPKPGGVWTAAWGDDEDDPDYISTARLVGYDPPRKLVMKYGEYHAKSGSLPFQFADDALTSFTIEPDGGGCRLRVEQTGFPCDEIADEFYAACETGWKNTFQGIRDYVSSSRATYIKSVG